jgi:hypothetical protein
MPWKRLLVAYLVVTLVAFVVWMIPVTKQFGKSAVWPQALNVAKQSAIWPYVAFRRLVRF